MKRVLAFALASLMVFVLGACTSSEAPAASENPAAAESTSNSAETPAPADAGSAEGIEIAYLINSTSDTFETYVYNNAKEYCEENGITLVLHDAQNDAATQLSQLEIVCQNGVDAVVCVPIDTSGDGREYRNIADKYNIPIVSVVREMKTAWVKVSVDSVKVGRMQAQHVIDTLGEKLDVALLMGTLGTEDQMQRTQSNLEVFGQYPGINIVYEETGEWQRDKAMTVCENWLQAGKHFDVVVANNDEMAIGAANAIKAAGKSDEIKVFGIDGNESGLQEINNGVLAATVFQPTTQGQIAIEACIDCMNGKYTGEGEPVWITVDPEIITKENLNDFWVIVFGEPLS